MHRNVAQVGLYRARRHFMKNETCHEWLGKITVLCNFTRRILRDIFMFHFGRTSLLIVFHMRIEK